MKFSVSSYSYLRYMLTTGADYYAICDHAKKAGFDGIEFTGLEDRFNAGRGEDSKIIAQKIRDYCSKLGLEICAYALGADILNHKDAAVAQICRDIDVAKILGAPVVRFDVCYALPRDKHPYTHSDAISEMVPYIRQIADYAEERGIKVCTENHGHAFQHPDIMEALIRTVNHKNYGWLCDVGNFLCVDTDPIYAVTKAMPYTFHIHFKDFLFKPGNQIAPKGFGITKGGNYIRGTVIGHGAVPVINCATIIKRSGYDGYITVEFEGMEDNFLAIEAGLDFLKTHF